MERCNLRMMGIPIIYITYKENNLTFLDNVIAEIKARKISTKKILYRTSEQKNLEKILKLGTDRAGFPEKKAWKHSEEFGMVILHEDMIFATTKEEIMYGEQQDKKFQTSLKKFSIINHPLLLAYDSNCFVKLKEKQYTFKHPKNKLNSLLAIFVVNKKMI